MSYKIIRGDCIEVLKTLADNSVDSIITDPPYELGFMGKKWDNTGIAYNADMWKECLRVLKHGGHLLSFGGSRTYHRMASAIEDAGFEIRDQIMWIYSTGFPKSLNVEKQLEKIYGCKKDSEHCLRQVPEANISSQEPVAETEREVLQQGMSQQGISFEQEQFPNNDWSKESCMEGRSDLLQDPWKLQRCEA